MKKFFNTYNFTKFMVVFLLSLTLVGCSSTTKAPDGTYHSSDVAATIGLLYFIGDTETLTFYSDGTVNYYGGENVFTGEDTNVEGSYTLSDGILTINMNDYGNYSFEYSRDVFGGLTLKDTETNTEFKFEK